MTKPSAIKLKRAYEAPEREDGRRILVDRVWPRGIRKEAAAVDRWLKDVAPSTALRQWFGHDPERSAEFRRRYRAELEKHREAPAELRRLARDGTLTLIHGARGPFRNQAVVLRELLLER